MAEEEATKSEKARKENDRSIGFLRRTTTESSAPVSSRSCPLFRPFDLRARREHEALLFSRKRKESESENRAKRGERGGPRRESFFFLPRRDWQGSEKNRPRAKAANSSLARPNPDSGAKLSALENHRCRREREKEARRALESARKERKGRQRFFRGDWRTSSALSLDSRLSRSLFFLFSQPRPRTPSPPPPLPHSTTGHPRRRPGRQARLPLPRGPRQVRPLGQARRHVEGGGHAGLHRPDGRPRGLGEARAALSVRPGDVRDRHVKWFEEKHRIDRDARESSRESARECKRERESNRVREIKSARARKEKRRACV